MCLKGSTTTHIRRRVGQGVKRMRGGEVLFLTTLERPVTGQLADVAIQMF
jgi:hypothetical protein